MTTGPPPSSSFYSNKKSSPSSTNGSNSSTSSSTDPYRRRAALEQLKHRSTRPVSSAPPPAAPTGPTPWVPSPRTAASATTAAATTTTSSPAPPPTKVRSRSPPPSGVSHSMARAPVPSAPRSDGSLIPRLARVTAGPPPSSSQQTLPPVVQMTPPPPVVPMTPPPPIVVPPVTIPNGSGRAGGRPAPAPSPPAAVAPGPRVMTAPRSQGGPPSVTLTPPVPAPTPPRHQPLVTSPPAPTAPSPTVAQPASESRSSPAPPTAAAVPPPSSAPLTSPTTELNTARAQNLSMQRQLQDYRAQLAKAQADAERASHLRTVFIMVKMAERRHAKVRLREVFQWWRVTTQKSHGANGSGRAGSPMVMPPAPSPGGGVGFFTPGPNMGRHPLQAHSSSSSLGQLTPLGRDGSGGSARRLPPTPRVHTSPLTGALSSPSSPGPPLEEDNLDISHENWCHAARTVPSVYESPLASFSIRAPFGVAAVSPQHRTPGYEAAHPLRPGSLEVTATIVADGSVLVLTGDGKVFYGMEGEGRVVRDFNGGEMRPLGFVSFIDAEGVEKEYSLDDVYEEADAARNAYGASLITAATALQAYATTHPYSTPAAPPSSNINGIAPAPPVEAPPAPPTSPPTRAMESPEGKGADDVFLTYLFSLIGMTFRLFWFMLVRVPFQLFKMGLVLGLCLVTATTVWYFFADDHGAMEMGVGRYTEDTLALVY